MLVLPVLGVVASLVKRLAPSVFATQPHQKKHKLYSLHVPEMECIGKHKAGQGCSMRPVTPRVVRADR
jgi:hypothetical protein